MGCCSGDGDDKENERPTSDDDERYYGERLRYDTDFKGPLSKRSCTDVTCLLIFVAFLAGWGFVANYAIKHGDLDKVLVPTDSLGRKCGIDSAVTDRPYLFFFDLAKCVDPTVPFVGCDTTQVCVRQCPQTKFLFDRNECLQTGNFTGIIDSLICQLDVDKRQLRNCNDIEAKINENKCARWYLESKSFLKRCVSALPPAICPLVLRNHLQLNAKRMSRDLSTPIRFPDQILSLGQGAAREESRDCSDMGSQILRKKASDLDTMFSRIVGNVVQLISNQTSTQALGERIVEDVMKTWQYVIVGLLLAVISCMILIAVMRWIAAPFVWISIFGVLGALGFGIYYSFKVFKDLKNRPLQDTIVSTNMLQWIRAQLEKPNTWLYFGIALSVIFVILFLVVLVLRKRIVIATALVKEGSKAVSSIWSTVLFPIFPWIFQIAVAAFAIFVGLCLASVGQPVNHIVRLNGSSCICTGPAAHYADGVICTPDVFKRNCEDRSSPSYECSVAACNFKEIASPREVSYYQAYNIVGVIWGLFFISALGEMVLAATFATWYWTFDKNSVPFFTLTVGLGRTVRYHLGTVAFGSLIVSICRVIRLILEYIDRKVKKWDNDVSRCILCCLKCFFWCLERFLKFINKNAYIMCAIHGKPFCSSARDAFNLLMRNFLRVIALDQVTDFLFFLTKVLVTLGTGATAYIYFTSEQTNVQLNFVAVPVTIIMIGTYLIASVFFSVYSMAVDTLFLCFLEDCERNDGSNDKPFYMSKQLMKILGRKNVAAPDHDHDY